MSRKLRGADAGAPEKRSKAAWDTWFVLLILGLWLVFLSLPIGRANLSRQALETGFPYPRDSEHQSIVDNYVDLPDEDALRATHPLDRTVALGLTRDASEYQRSPQADHEPDSQQACLDALLQLHPRDPVLLAERLRTQIPEYDPSAEDNPFFNGRWPVRSADSESTADRTRELDLGERGAAAEPNNAFFDWMRLDALFALHREPEAFAVLHYAAGKTGFDDHMREEMAARLDAYRLARPLSPFEQEEVAGFALNLYQGVVETVARDLVWRAAEMRAGHDDQRAISTDFDLLRLGRVLRSHAYNFDGSQTGAATEDMALRYLYLAPQGPNGPEFPPLSKPATLLGTTTNLAGYADAHGRSDVVRLALSEAAVVSTYNFDGTGPPTPFPYVGPPDQWCVALAAVQEHGGRLLLRTLPLCFALWLLSAGAVRRRHFESENIVPLWKAVIAGLLIFLILMGGEVVFDWHVHQGSSDAVVAYCLSPSLLLLAPEIVVGGAAGIFLLVAIGTALSATHRTALAAHASGPADGAAAWRAPWVKGGTLGAQALTDWDFTPLMRSIAVGTWYLTVIGLFMWVCTRQSVDGGRASDYSRSVNGLWATTIWIGNMAVLAVACLRSPHRRRIAALAMLNLRRLTGSYLLTACFLYAVTGLPTAFAEDHFTRDYRAYLSAGEMAPYERP